MNLAIAHLASLARGIDLIAAASQFSLEQLRQAGPASAAQELHALATTYFGECTFSRKQESAVKAARQRGHSLPDLVIIEKFVRRIKHKRHAWDLRVELCATRPEQLELVARKRVKEIMRPKPPTAGVKIMHGSIMSRLILTAPSSIIEDIRPNIDPSDPVGSLHKAFSSGTLQRPTVHTLGVVSLPHFARIMQLKSSPQNSPAAGNPSPTHSSGEHPVDDGSDIRVSLSNGTEISGAELVSRMLEEQGLVMLVDPHVGPVKLYRTRRLATSVQRTMARAEHTQCVWPGCRTGSDRCQIHHIVEWKDGGLTNPENLVPLCAYHNGINGQPGRGKIVRNNGSIAWLSADASRTVTIPPAHLKPDHTPGHALAQSPASRLHPDPPNCAPDQSPPSTLHPDPPDRAPARSPGQATTTRPAK